MRAQIIFLISNIFLFVFVSITNACTGIILQDSTNTILIKNHMNGPGIGYLMTNNRGVKKSAFILPPEKPIEWISKYGSVTINEISKDLPNAGMNEAGLVIESTYLEDSEYPQGDERFALNTLQWIQYNLDNSSTVFDVIANDTIIRVGQNYSKQHYIVCDKKGNKALIEFIDGKMVYYLNEDFFISVMANDTYKKSMQYLKQFIGFDGHENIIIADSICNRSSLESFIVGAKMVNDYKNEDLLQYAFHTNATIREKWSDWEVTYDTKSLKIYFKAYKNNDLKIVDLSEIEFNCSAKEYVLNFDEITNGLCNNNFEPYSTNINRQLVTDIFQAYKFLNDVPEEFKEQLIIYPNNNVCTQ
jgi:choloylglycine hydrolase